MSNADASYQLLRDERVIGAAISVIKTSICAENGEHILVVFDRFGLEVADGFVEAALRIHQPLTAIYAPVPLQESLNQIVEWKSLRELLHSSGSLVTALTDGHSSTSFRIALLDYAIASGLKVVHMPGVNEDIFAASTSGVDFASLNDIANKTALSLGHASAVTIKTCSKVTGAEHNLHLSVKDRVGHADGGKAGAGKIINIPTGEAYIATIESSAQGTIIINGSFPEVQLAGGPEVMLKFSEGVLDLRECTFPPGGSGDHCRNLLTAATNQFPEGMQIGELGVGLNGKVGSVAGRTILDEKALGTAHIAIGSNAPFGGSNHAPYHFDLVFFPKAILLDGTELDLRWKADLDTRSLFHAKA